MRGKFILHVYMEKRELVPSSRIQNSTHIKPRREFKNSTQKQVGKKGKKKKIKQRVGRR